MNWRCYKASKELSRQIIRLRRDAATIRKQAYALALQYRAIGVFWESHLGCRRPLRIQFPEGVRPDPRMYSPVKNLPGWFRLRRDDVPGRAAWYQFYALVDPFFRNVASLVGMTINPGEDWVDPIVKLVGKTVYLKIPAYVENPTDCRRITDMAYEKAVAKRRRRRAA